MLDSREFWVTVESVLGGCMGATTYEIAVIGAGVAGLTCAQQLHQAGYRVITIDKSRGLGGRLATRRLAQTHADHGVCYLKPKREPFADLIQTLCDRSLVRPWPETLHTQGGTTSLTLMPSAPRYASPTGATTIAKFLAQDLTLALNQRITAILPDREGWKLTSEDPEFEVIAAAVIVAIPAPQAYPLVASIVEPALAQQIQAIEFAPCMAAIAAYAPDRLAAVTALGLQGVAYLNDDRLAWVGLESTKQLDPLQPAVIIQSQAQFAADHFEAPDLAAIGQQLCDRVAQHLQASWIAQPEVLQVHRWRYAFALNPLSGDYLAANTEFPLVCTGDWCRGDRVEDAFLSGLAAADHLNQQLKARSLKPHFWRTIGIA